MPPTSAKPLSSPLAKLHITQKSSKPADSWEDEADQPSLADDTAITPTQPDDSPTPPPPTPSSPSPYTSFPPYGTGTTFTASRDAKPSSSSRGHSDHNTNERRPDKSTAIASRLIAAGIGQKAPRRTQEQREYDNAIKIQEKKKRDQAKADEEKKQKAREQAIKDVWGD